MSRTIAEYPLPRTFHLAVATRMLGALFATVVAAGARAASCHPGAADSPVTTQPVHLPPAAL